MCLWPSAVNSHSGDQFQCYHSKDTRRATVLQQAVRPLLWREVDSAIHSFYKSAGASIGATEHDSARDRRWVLHQPYGNQLLFNETDVVGTISEEEDEERNPGPIDVKASNASLECSRESWRAILPFIPRDLKAKR